MTIEMDRIGTFAEEWGRMHLVKVSQELVELVKRKIPADVASPSVLGVIFYTSQKSDFMQNLRKKHPLNRLNWNDIVDNVVDHAFKESGRDRYMTAFTRMALGYSFLYKSEWETKDPQILGWYESLAKEGLLIRNPNGQFELDNDIKKTFVSTFESKAYDWIKPAEMFVVLDDIQERGPIPVV